MAVAKSAASNGILATLVSSAAHSLAGSVFLLTVGASDTFLVVGIEADTSTPGTVTAHWDSTGTNQAMTQIGTTITKTGGLEPVSVALMGLVNPTAGQNTVGFSMSGQATAVNAYVFGISFTGSATSSVAAATEGAATNSGTSTTASVASGVSIPSGDMAVSFGSDAGNDFSGTYPSDGGTSIGHNNANASNAVAEYYSGAGATITFSQALNASDAWAAAIVGIKAAGGGVVNNQTVSAGCSSATTFARSAGKIVSAGCASSTSFARAMAKGVSVGCSSATSFLKSVAKPVSVSSTSATTIAHPRTVVQAISAGCSSATAFVKQAGKTISAGCASATSFAKSAGKVVSAGCSSATTFARSAGKTIAAGCVSAVSVVASFISGGGTTFTQTISAACSTATGWSTQMIAKSGVTEFLIKWRRRGRR